jgi:hypothetical protein
VGERATTAIAALAIAAAAAAPTVARRLISMAKDRRIFYAAP